MKNQLLALFALNADYIIVLADSPTFEFRKEIVSNKYNRDLVDEIRQLKQSTIHY